MSQDKVSQGQTPAGAINRHLINQYSLSAHYMPLKWRTRRHSPCSHGTYILGGETNNSQIKKWMISDSKAVRKTIK